MEIEMGNCATAFGRQTSRININQKQSFFVMTKVTIYKSFEHEKDMKA